MEIPQNFAVVRVDTGVAALQPRPIPELKDDSLLIKTETIALNPTDWTILDAPGLPGSIVGVDFAGTVVAVGAQCTEKWRVGERVAGFGHGGNDLNHEDGAFARFVAVKGALCMRVPESVEWDEAGGVWSGVGTVGYALYHILGLSWPRTGEGKGGTGGDVEGEPILIYGGSTATGTLAIQFAKMSGRRVLTSCSERHFKLVKSRGADAVYDYRVPDVGEQIRQDTNGTLTTVLDCIALESTAAICAAAISPSGGTYVNLLGIDSPRPDVKSIFFLGYALSGEDYIFEGEFYAAQPEVHAFAKEWFPFVEKLWAEERWRSHPVWVREGGLQGALEGMREMKEGRGPSGEKWIYRVAETVWPEVE